ENDYLLDGDDVIQQTFNALAKLAAAQMGYHGKQPETFFLDCLRAANMALVRKGIGMYSRIGIDASVDLLFQVAANYCRELESRRLLQMAHLNARPSESTNSAFGENRSVVISDSSATTELRKAECDQTEVHWNIADERKAALRSYKDEVREKT